MRTFSKDNIITDWQETVGLRAICVDSFELSDLDDPATFTVITFDNGKVAIQRDQPYHTTRCGLVDADDAEKYRNEIEKALAVDPAGEIIPGQKYQFHQLESWLN